MRRPALIFDFGNVVAHFDHGRAFTKLGARIGLSGHDLIDRLRPLGFAGLLADYESGQITARVFSGKVAELMGLTIPHDEFAAAWSDIFWANESIAPLIAFLKGRGYPLILGSNTNDIHAARFRHQFAETLAHFDRLILSHEVGKIKPSAGFYLACAEAAEVEPEACVFIDDLPENIAGARAAGLVGLLYRTTSGLVDDLRRIGVEVPD